MTKTSINWTVKKLKGMHDGKDTLQMDHAIQRQSGQWDGDRLKKSLLIHSILADYPVPPIYCLKEAANGKDCSYSILDGKQRLTTVFDYIDGRYPLDAETPPVTLEGIVYDLGGKYFTDLDMECQQELLCFKFTIYGFEDADDDLIEEIFFRLNNSTPLSKPQKAMPLCGVSNAKFIKSILSDRFFSEICQFSALQRRKSDDMCTLLQAMMLLDSQHEGYEYTSISADEIMKYASHIKNNYSEEQKERLYNIIDYLEKVFPEKEKRLKKINIPIVMLAADTAMGDDYDAGKNIYRVGPIYFRQWFSYFFDECYDDYKQYCSSGSIKKEKTIKRIEIMGASLADYFELEESSESEENDPSLLESSIPENDPSTSQENASSEQASLIGDDATDSNPSAQEEHPDTDNPSLADDGAPLTDAGTAEDGSPIENGTEIPGLQKLPEYASVAENTDSYAAPGHAESNETEGKEPPEGTANNTE